MNGKVFVENLADKLSDTAVSEREVVRYMGGSGIDESMKALVAQCVSECDGLAKGKVCYAEYPVSFDSNDTSIIDLGFCKVKSEKLAKNLFGCKRIVLFAATVGIGFDRLISKYSVVSPSRSLCVSAIGSERIEALCDIFCDELSRRYGATRPRFSAGYGDLPLSLQIDIFKALDCHKNIGVSLNDSIFMTPVKSVTAIVGVKGGE